MPGMVLVSYGPLACALPPSFARVVQHRRIPVSRGPSRDPASACKTLGIPNPWPHSCACVRAAASSGDTASVESLPAGGCDPCFQEDEGGCSPLMLAAAAGHAPIVRALLAAGAAVDAGGIGSRSPLQMLMYYGSMDRQRQRIVPLLLRAGASIPIRTLEALRWTSFGRPPVAKAVYSYLQRILDTPGGFTSYEQIHLRALTRMLAPKLRLPTELARIVVAFWHSHLGFYEVPYDLMVRADRNAALPAALADARRVLAHERYLRSIPPDRRRAMEAESQRLRDARAT